MPALLALLTLVDDPILLVNDASVKSRRKREAEIRFMMCQLKEVIKKQTKLTVSLDIDLVVVGNDVDEDDANDDSEDDCVLLLLIDATDFIVTSLRFLAPTDGMVNTFRFFGIMLI